MKSQMDNSRAYCINQPGCRWFFLNLLIALALSACGGGGGGSTTPLPAAPANVLATARDGNNLIKWTAVSGATSYNVYWSTADGVNKTNGTKISVANNPQAHTGLTNDTPYYYVVTALGAGGESAESAQASATPAAAAVVADPLYPDQWHLKNTGQFGATGASGVIGEDINV